MKSKQSQGQQRKPETNRSSLVLLHYSAVAGVPLLITLLLFYYFSNNSAQFQQQPLGIKFGGPIAAYAGLVLMMQGLLNRIFKTLREEDLHKQKLAFSDLSAQEASERSESFARLTADFCLMEIISMRRAGFSKNDVTQVVSVVRKNAYKLPKVVGSFTIEHGQYILAELLGAAINSAEFVAELVQFVSTLFEDQQPMRTSPHPYSEIPGVKFMHAHQGHVLPVEQPPVPVPPGSVFQSMDVELARKKLSNLIWHHCEIAIKRPDQALKNAFLAP